MNAGKESLKRLADLLDNYYQHNLDNEDLKEMLDYKKTETFEDFFQQISSITEKDIALTLLYQVLSENQEIKLEIENNCKRTNRFQSFDEAYVFIEDLLSSGATQEAKTTVCILGNTSAGKSSLVQTLREYCNNKSQKPRSILTGDPQNKQLLETKVLELIQDVKLNPSVKSDIKVLKNPKVSKFGLISSCPGGVVIQDDETNDHLQISFIDFAGHSEYVSCSTLFMKETGIFLICFSAEKLAKASTEYCFFPSIGTYFEIVTQCCPAPIFVLVATKMDLCQTFDLEPKLNDILDAAREHLQSISKRSKGLRDVFLLDEIIRTSSAECTQTILEGLISKLVAICGNRDLLDVKLVTIPKAWRRMIEKARTNFRVSIDGLVQDYKEVILKHDDEAVTEEMLSLGGWEGVIKNFKKRERKQNVQHTSQVSEEPAVESAPQSNDMMPKESRKEAEAALPSLKLKLKQDGPQKENEDSRDLQKKMKTILSILSSNNEVFWFRFVFQTLPKAQRPRGFSSAYQSNFFRSYHKFLHKS